MTQFELIKWVQLVAAAVWTGGMIVLAVLIGAVRRAKLTSKSYASFHEPSHGHPGWPWASPF